jgi:hypothetical protein
MPTRWKQKEENEEGHQKYQRAAGNQELDGRVFKDAQDGPNQVHCGLLPF